MQSLKLANWRDESERSRSFDGENLLPKRFVEMPSVTVHCGVPTGIDIYTPRHKYFKQIH